MAYALKYVIHFIDVDDDPFVIEIAEKDYSGSTVTELTGGENPITISYKDEDCVYNPLRFAAATITVIEEEYFISLFATDPHQFKVDLYKGEGRELKFTGFISPEVYSQDYNGYQKEFQIEVISALSTLEYYYFDNLIFDTSVRLLASPSSNWNNTLGIINRIFMEVIPNCYSAIYFPNIFSSSGAYKLYDFMSLPKNFENDEDEPMNYKEILEEFCKFFGWTLTEKDGEVYFLDLDYMLQGRSQYFKYNGNLSSVVTGYTLPTTIQQLSEKESTGSNNTLSMIGGYNEQSVIASDYEYDSKIFPVLDKLVKFGEGTVTADFKGSGGRNGKSDKRQRTVKYYWIPESKSTWKLHLYSRSETKFNDVTDTLSLPPGNISQISNYAGAHIENQIIIDEDSSYNGDQGIFYVLKNGTGAYSSFGADKAYLLSNTYQPVISYKGPQILLNDAKIIISGEVYFGILEQALYTDREQKRDCQIKDLNGSPYFMARDSFRVPMKIKIGNYWWSGSQWSVSESIFSVYTDIVKGTHYDTTWLKLAGKDFEKDYVIPINQPLFGSVEITIYMPRYIYSGSKDPYYQRFALLRGLEISLDKEDESDPYVENNQDTVYTGTTGQDYINEGEDVELKITTKNSSVNSYSKLIENVNNRYEPVDTVYFNTYGGNIKPEELLLRKYLNQYNKPKIVLTQDTHLDYKPYQLLEDTGFTGRKFFLMSEEINYREKTSSLKMTEVWQ